MNDLITQYGWPLAILLAQIGLIIGLVMFSVAYLTYAERKILAAISLHSPARISVDPHEVKADREERQGSAQDVLESGRPGDGLHLERVQ